MDLNRAVAENVKRIRKTRKMSIERTAQLAGISRSMLGQVERGEANPSVAFLEKLALALKVSPGEFLASDDFTTLLSVRDEAAEAKRLQSGKVVLRPSLPYDPKTGLETYFLDLYIGAVYEPELSVPGTVCCATVLSGTAYVTAEGQEFTLMERDALRFAADRPHVFRNPLATTARLLLIYQTL